MWGEPVEAKKARFLAHLDSLHRGQVNLVVVHAAERPPEMDVLFDNNAAGQNASDGTPMVSRHRQAELEMVLSPELSALVRSGSVRLINYQQLIAHEGGPSAMRQPHRPLTP